MPEKGTKNLLSVKVTIEFLSNVDGEPKLEYIEFLRRNHKWDRLEADESECIRKDSSSPAYVYQYAVSFIPKGDSIQYHGGITEYMRSIQSINRYRFCDVNSDRLFEDVSFLKLGMVNLYDENDRLTGSFL